MVCSNAGSENDVSSPSSSSSIRRSSGYHSASLLVASISNSLAMKSQIISRLLLVSIDSGLSLTTVRDVTELESDRESKLNGSVILRNSKAYRSMPMRRNHDSDSDEVFDEVISLIGRSSSFHLRFDLEFLRPVESETMVSTASIVETIFDSQSVIVENVGSHGDSNQRFISEEISRISIDGHSS